MRLGALLHQLWRHKLGAGLCLAFAVVMSLWSLYHLSIAPPGLTPRHLQIGAASTTVMVDAPKSKIVDLRANTQDFQSLTTRADLLSNVMASTPVRAFIAQRAGVPERAIVADASLGADLPRSATEPGSERRSTDLIQETDKYRLAISSNEAQPIIYVAAQAPSGEAAARLANAAVDGLNDYLTMMADREGIAPTARTRLIQFGRAQGGVVNPSVDIEIGLLTFLISFVVACAAFRVVLRVRHGWALDAERERRDGKNWWLPKLETVPPSRLGGHEPE
ncbi:MAG TPA: hypothetical protein VFG42_15725 [Baekduia sp.]|uniref:hypothetical protein n=1 Tax=Baekduia sp. TaxID=2600305 RepID=UPI002D77F956|nr:hypothetical protein [Baekduia sp.]HET6508241.1 hypothetical protein [Baekduia sp.]